MLFGFRICLPFCLVSTLQPCGHLLGKSWPLGSLVCDVFLSFCHFPIWCPRSGVVFLIFASFLTYIRIHIYSLHLVGVISMPSLRDADQILSRAFTYVLCLLKIRD